MASRMKLHGGVVIRISDSIPYHEIRTVELALPPHLRQEYKLASNRHVLRQRIIDAEDAPLDTDVTLLRELSNPYGADLTAQMRIDGGYGNQKKPTSMVEVRLLLVEELQGIRKTLEGVYDVMRVRVGLASPVWLARSFLGTDFEPSWKRT